MSSVSPLPSWLFTRRAAIASGLFVGIVYLITARVIASVASAVHGPLPVPSCFYGIGHTKPVVPGRGSFTGAGWPTRRAEQVKEANSKRVRAAAEHCRPGACPREAKAAFRSAVFGYVADRANQSVRFYGEYGEEGLRFIQSLHGHGDDHEILTAMRELHRAGLFEPTHTGIEDAERMLLFKEPEAFRPCAVEGGLQK